MTVDDWPEWLPADWMIQIRKIDERKVKCYIDPEGNKFYSKPQVDRHLKTNKKSTDSEQTNNADGPPVDLSVEPDDPHTNEDPETTPQGKSARLRSRNSSKKSKENESPLTGDGSSSKRKSSKRKNQASEWLPEGWTVTEKTKSSGAKYKVYQDPITGKKFFSRPQVMTYLGNTESSTARQKLVCVTPLNSCPVVTSGAEEATEVEKNETTGTTESTRMSPDYEVISRTPAEGLPPGWIKEIRVRPHGSIKKKDPYYLDPLSGYVFFSKLDALRYLDSGDIKKCAMRPLRRDMNQEDQPILTEEELASPTTTEPPKETETPKVLTNGSIPESKTEGTVTEKRKVRSITGDGHLPIPEASKKEEAAADWPPDGWVVELHYRDYDNKKIKCYKETATGKKFYSKPQVMNYLRNATSPNTNSRKRKGRKRKPAHNESDSEFDEPIRPKRSQRKTTEIETSDFKEVIVSSPAEGLPPGWIKEIRTRIGEGRERKDPFYIDPVSGYIFRSKLDALRYLETGDINLCAIKPRKKDINGNEVLVTDHETPVKNKTAKQIFEGSDAELTDGDKETENNNNTENTENTPGVRRGTRERVAKQKLPVGRASSRLKAHKPEAGSGVNLEKEKGVLDEVAAGVNVEKQPDENENQMDYELGDDASWEDPFHFAVKTLRSEFPGVENEEAPKKVD